MIVVHGVARFGKVDEAEGEYLVTRFHHVFLMPLVPIGSEWVTRRRAAGLEGRACRLSAKSVAAAYLRTWGLALAFVLVGYAARGSVLAGVGASLLVILALATLRWYRMLDPRELRRIALQRPVLGLALDPARLPLDTAHLLLPAVQDRFEALSGGRTAMDVAREGPVSDDEAAHAFVVLRLVAACSHGVAATEAFAASERLLDRATLPVPSTDPYRDASAPPVVTWAPLLTAYLLPAHRWHFVLATLALWVGCLAVHPPRALRCLCSTSDPARTGAKKLAYEAYPEWVARNPNRGCPTSDQLAELAGSAKDPWGERYHTRCDSLPDAAVGIAVWSVGPNRRDEGGAGDDVASWMP